VTGISQLPSAWAPAPLVLVPAFFAALRFAQAFRRLRSRGRSDHAGWDRPLLFAAGLALVVLPLVSPLDAAGDQYLLSAHMLEHVLIGDAGPALLLLAVRGPLLAFVLPAGCVRFLAQTPVHRAFEWLSRPAACAGAWGCAMAFWHMPAVYDAALRHVWLHDLEHASFLGAGFLVWTALIDPARRRRLSVGRRAALAGVVFLFGQALSDVLFMTTSPLYPAYAGNPERLFGISPLADQQYAGLVMMAEQLVTLGTCVALLGASLLRPACRRLATA
jgi:putative membrane protein